MKQNEKYIRTIIDDEVRKKWIDPIILGLSFLFSIVMFFITTFKIKDLQVDNLTFVWFYIINAGFWVWLFYKLAPERYKQSRKIINKQDILNDFAKWSDEKYCLKKVKIDSYDLARVKKQTEQICLEAVKNEGLALPYVKEQTYRICKEAVKQNRYAIYYIRDKKILLKILDEME